MAAELVGGALLSAFLQVAFDRLASREILDFFRKRRFDETLLKKLNTMLSTINAVIDDAEQKQITNTNVKVWLEELKDAMYDAEDILDEIDYEVTKSKVEAEFQTSTSKVRNFFSASISSFHKKIETRMKQVLANLQYLQSRKVELGLKPGSGVVGSLTRLPTTSLVDEGGTFGRSDDKEMIIKWLLSSTDNSSHLSIISIVGMSGLGKTTLAKLVYNDQRMKGEFDLKAWVCVSDEFDVMRVTRTIVEAITKSSDDTKDLNMLQIKLKEMLIGKRFLLVLDDVWNENYMQWEALQLPLNDGACGSKIVVTTRNDKVASTMRSSKIHLLNHLTEEDSWLLFRRHAFNNGNVPPSSSNFEETGRKIMEKCKGLPLALKATGSLLYTKSFFEEWNDILKSHIWEEETNILPALRLSYHYLPSVLKRCFAYCSLFPKDYEFDKEDLVQLWMAENFLQGVKQRKDIKQLGDQLFHDLLSRSFFQQSSGDETRFVMHDLINDLAKDISGTFYFRLEVDKEQDLSERTRHFSFLCNGFQASERFEIIFKTKKLRTFLPSDLPLIRYFIGPISSKMIDDILSKFRCLRVLSFCCGDIEELPDSIGNLKHLRYLDLSKTYLRELPSSICLLYNLQTLKLRSCESLKKLPSNLHKLINLHYLEFRETEVKEMPKQLGRLKNLQVLSSFYVGKCRDTSIKQLGDLNLRGELSILELGNVVCPTDALEANLKNKICLEELLLGWSSENDESHSERDVLLLEKLQPHGNLKKLSISNYGGPKFPDWFVDNTLSNVVLLELSKCKYCLSLPSLGLLPSLKSLSISGFDSIESIGPEFYGNSPCTTPFGSLEILRFEDMMGWEKWEFENVSGAFPSLQSLYLENCPKLKEHLPWQLPSLTRLVISNCEELESSVPGVPTIHELVLRDCEKVELECLPSTLKIVQISGSLPECFSVEKIENTIANTCLEELEISHCADLELPLRYCHNFLQRMSINCSCDSLRIIPLDLFPNLQSLSLGGCRNLEMIYVSEGHRHDFTSLTMLDIKECPKFVSFPKGGFLASKLERCWIQRLQSLKSLPEHMHIMFPSLKYILISYCPQVGSLPDNCSWPPNLVTLKIVECRKLMASRMEWNLHSHTSLRILDISDADVECFPEVGLLPTTLTHLSFWQCLNLRTLNCNGLSHLSALKQLKLELCPKLQYLPKEGLPSSLSFLYIVKCPLLKKRYKRQKGKEWAKIAHIPYVRICDNLMRW